MAHTGGGNSQAEMQHVHSGAGGQAVQAQLANAQAHPVPSYDGFGSGSNNIVQSHWYRKSKDVINITINYPVPTTQKRKGAEFEFNIIQDTAEGVANEMVNELNVDPSFTKLISH